MQDILGAFENKVRKLVEEHLELRKELLASMEVNRGLKQTIQALLLEIDQLKANPIVTEEELEAQQLLQDAFAQVSAERDRLVEENQALQQEKEQILLERKQLLEAFESIQHEINTIQNNSDSFFAEYDQIKQSLEDQQEMQVSSNQRIAELEFKLQEVQAENNTLKQQGAEPKTFQSDLFVQESQNIDTTALTETIQLMEAQLAEHEMHRDRIVLENESLKIQLEASRESNRELKELVQKRQEFENQEKSATIVESIAEDNGIQRNEIKLKINEYIKEIDKCIAQLNE